MMRRTLDRNALISVGNLIVMNVVVGTDGIDPIVRTQIGSSNSQMVHFDVLGKVKNKVKLRTVYQYQVMNCSIDRGDQS